MSDSLDSEYTTLVGTSKRGTVYHIRQIGIVYPEIVTLYEQDK